jgi:hypothetical protein
MDSKELLNWVSEPRTIESIQWLKGDQKIEVIVPDNVHSLCQPYEERYGRMYSMCHLSSDDLDGAKKLVESHMDGLLMAKFYGKDWTAKDITFNWWFESDTSWLEVLFEVVGEMWWSDGKIRTKVTGEINDRKMAAIRHYESNCSLDYLKNLLDDKKFGRSV